MSYDLMVFDPDRAPRKPAAFVTWYTRQTQWDEAHGYDDPKVCTPALRGWFEEMIQSFPALNGPFAREEELDNPKTTDYCVGRTVIYAGFGWSQAEAAYRQVLSAAQKHGVGFYDLSSADGAVWLPDSGGGAEVV